MWTELLGCVTLLHRLVVDVTCETALALASLICLLRDTHFTGLHNSYCAVRQTITDMSPYVRKVTAHAIPKIYKYVVQSIEIHQHVQFLLQ
jgi:vesicle coat complex subunit